MKSEQDKSTNPLNQLEDISLDFEMYLSAVLNNTNDPIFVKDAECRLLLVNDAFCIIFGLTRHEIIGKTLAENVTQEEREHFLSIDRQVLEEGKEVLCEETLTISGLQTKTILTRKNRFIDLKGHYFLIGVIHDITEKKKLEQEKNNANAEKEKRADELALANKELAFQNAEKDKRTDELVLANKKLAFQSAEKDKLILSNEAKDKLILANEENQLLLRELKQSQKMEALGKLTGGIAHEYNNMLGIMLGYSELLKAPFIDNVERLKYASQIEHAGNRATTASAF
jgi:PAS domain S-box-containing protein